MSEFRPSGQHVVHETFDDQVLIVRADTGAYYSLDGSAALVWAHLLAGDDDAAIVAAMVSRYPDSGDEAHDAVSAFLARLLEEGLIEAGAIATPVPVPVAPVAARGWSPPTVDVYNDMKDLLLFDPIHEVGPEGWPQAADDRR